MDDVLKHDPGSACVVSWAAAKSVEPCTVAQRRVHAYPVSSVPLLTVTAVRRPLMDSPVAAAGWAPANMAAAEGKALTGERVALVRLFRRRRRLVEPPGRPHGRCRHRSGQRGRGRAATLCAFVVGDGRDLVALLADYGNVAAVATYRQSGFDLKPLAAAHQVTR
ncbi:MAG: hypothetical protein SYR96_00500 [Actinomycetota bacterium]|nr:hypothetical protein [Actinomycetota bacterium]